MSALSGLRKLLLSNDLVRRKIAFDIKQYYFQDLDLFLPLGNGLQCPIAFPDAGWSFKEIFLENEYGSAFNEVPLPSRWLDLGCHAGYFSLWVLWKRLSSGLDDNVQALLVDADERLNYAVARMIEINGLKGKFQFAQGLLAAGNGTAEFFQRSAMSSSTVPDGQPMSSVSVKVFPATAIESLLPAPYDLIKIDVEGAEYEVLTNYADLLNKANHLILEWHSWHKGGGSEAQIISMTEQLGFKLRRQICEARTVDVAGKQEQTGTHLYERLSR